MADVHVPGEMPPHMVAVYIIICVCLVICAGMMAGLTLGLLSLDKVDLEVIKRSGTAKDRWLVSQVEPLLSHPHYLLATLLLCNAGAMEALPIFLDRLLNPLAAILISVTAILVFGEIVPQAVCKRYGLQVGAYLAWPVRLIMLVTGILTWPIGKLLDWVLGEESALFRRHELKALVTLHAEPQEGEEVTALTLDEVTVIQGAMDMATKTAESAMTPVEKVFMLSTDDVINLELLHRVIAAGHSRLPVYGGTNKQDILGLILVKELVLVDEQAGVKVRDLRLREVPFIRADIPLYEALKIFRMGRSHMAYLTRVTSATPPPPAQESNPQDPAASAAAPVEDSATSGTAAAGADSSGGGGGQLIRVASGNARHGRSFFKPSLSQQGAEEVIGIITIEDVLEELLQAEILDETDMFVDNMQTIKTTNMMSLQQLPANLRRFLTGSSATRRAMLRPSAADAASTAAAGAPGAGMAQPLLMGQQAAGAVAAAPARGGLAQQLQVARGNQQLSRSTSASALGAAAAAGVISAARTEGGHAPALVGAAAAAGALAAHGHLPLGPEVAAASPSRLRQSAGGCSGGGGSSAPIAIRRPAPANIPRRGGSSANLFGSAGAGTPGEVELAAGSAGAGGASPAPPGGQLAASAPEQQTRMG